MPRIYYVRLSRKSFLKFKRKVRNNPINSIVYIKSEIQKRKSEKTGPLDDRSLSSRLIGRLHIIGTRWSRRELHDG